MERYVIGQDYNTKDWFVYDNETNRNVCWCDTEEEAEEVVGKYLEKEIKNMDKTRELAISIIDLFEELLDEYDVTIPSEDRDMEMEDMTPEEIEEAGFARLYGTDYYALEDKIVELLSK